jgi:hypothetical protein
VSYDPYANPYITQSPAGSNKPSGNSQGNTQGNTQAQPGNNSLAPNTGGVSAANSGSSGSSRPSTGQGSSGATQNSTGPSGTSQGGIDLTYDPSNPVRALRAALSSQGIYAGGNNPMIRYLMSMAQGLATSFLAKGGSGGLGNNSADAVAGQGGLSSMFQHFLQGGMGGGGTNLRGLIGSNPSTDLIQAANALHTGKNVAAQPGGVALNPFLSQLDELLGQNGNASQMISSVYAPFLGSYGRAYQNALGAQEDIGTPWLYDGNPLSGGREKNTNNTDIFSYLLGMR